MHRQEEMRNVLMAIRQEDVPLAKNIIGNTVRAVFCHSLEQAQASLDHTIDSVVCGVHFDNGKVFDYLRHVRSRADTRHLSVFILLGAGSRYSPSIIHGMRRAAEVLGATAFTDLTHLTHKFGREQAFEILRQGLRDAQGRKAPASVLPQAS